MRLGVRLSTARRLGGAATVAGRAAAITGRCTPDRSP